MGRSVSSSPADLAGEFVRVRFVCDASCSPADIDRGSCSPADFAGEDVSTFLASQFPESASARNRLGLGLAGPGLARGGGPAGVAAFQPLGAQGPGGHLGMLGGGMGGMGVAAQLDLGGFPGGLQAVRLIYTLFTWGKRCSLTR